MDLITQGILGASTALLINHNVERNDKKSQLLIVIVIGFTAGLAADADVFIRSSQDQLLFLEYHRAFTHSLLFIPVGGLVVASLLSFIFKTWTFKRIYLYSFLGYSTHALLDACTSYGTQLYWPFSHERVAWNLISVIDPVYSLLLLAGVLLTFYFKNLIYNRLAFVISILYLSFGLYQQLSLREYLIQNKLVKSGQRFEVKPAFGTLILWRVIKDHGEFFSSLAIRKIPFTDFQTYPGVKVSKVPLDYPTSGAIEKNDVERFRWFSKNYLYFINEELIGDFRYSLLPHNDQYLWAIRLRGNNRPVEFITQRKISPADRKNYFKMLQGLLLE